MYVMLMSLQNRDDDGTQETCVRSWFSGQGRGLLQRWYDWYGRNRQDESVFTS